MGRYLFTPSQLPLLRSLPARWGEPRSDVASRTGGNRTDPSAGELPPIVISHVGPVAALARCGPTFCILFIALASPLVRPTRCHVECARGTPANQSPASGRACQGLGRSIDGATTARVERRGVCGSITFEGRVPELDFCARGACAARAA